MSEILLCVECEVMMECEGRLCARHCDEWAVLIQMGLIGL